MFFFSWQLLFSQQDPLFTQYMYTKLEFNPATAGDRNALAADLLTRFQWTGVEGAPQTTCVTLSSPLPNPHIALGFYAYRDALGPSVDYNIMASFAYRVLFPASRLSFGISAGIKHLDINWNLLNPKDPGDPELSPDVSNRVVPDVDFGIWYQHPVWYAGISARHLLQNQMVISSTTPTGETAFTRLLRNYYGIAGGRIRLSEQFDLMPSLLVKYIQDAPVQADISVRVLFREILLLGVSYRTEKSIGLLIVVTVGKGFSLGYSYDIWLNVLRSYNRGSHEIRLSYEIDLINRNRMLTPRYF